MVSKSFMVGTRRSWYAGDQRAGMVRGGGSPLDPRRWRSGPVARWVPVRYVHELLGRSGANREAIGFLANCGRPREFAQGPTVESAIGRSPVPCRRRLRSAARIAISLVQGAAMPADAPPHLCRMSAAPDIKGHPDDNPGGAGVPATPIH